MSNHYLIHLKLILHCKPIILQFFKMCLPLFFNSWNHMCIGKFHFIFIPCQIYWASYKFIQIWKCFSHYFFNFFFLSFVFILSSGTQPLHVSTFHFVLQVSGVLIIFFFQCFSSLFFMLKSPVLSIIISLLSHFS